MTLAEIAHNWHRLTLAAVEAVVGEPETEEPQPADAWEGIIPEFDR